MEEHAAFMEETRNTDGSLCEKSCWKEYTWKTEKEIGR
jgi:hypothetical protein